MPVTTNPFAIAAEALLEKADRLGTRVLYGEPALAPHLAETRSALAVFERLAAMKVEVAETPGAVVCQVYYEDDGMTRAWGQRVELVSSGEWTVSRQPAEYGEAGAISCLLAALECRRRNGEVAPC